MGAVKRSRRILINPYYYHMALYTTKGADKRANKKAKRYMQRLEDIELSVEEKLQYHEINNRRKMAGLPVRRRLR